MVTLRAALDEANAMPGAQVITFDIPNTDPGFANGIYTIQRKANDGPVDQAMHSGGTLLYEIGNFREGAIHGFKYEDLNANGTYDGLAEKPLSGIRMLLSRDVDQDGTYESAEDSDDTDTSGQFSFTGLGPGRYRVEELVPTGAVATTRPFELQLLSGEVALAFADQAVAEPGQVAVVFPDLAFGNFYRGAVCGYKFNDLDGFGIDNGDPRVEGVTIVLDIDANEDGSFETNRTLLTDSQGYYCFRDLGPGKHQVRETLAGDHQLHQLGRRSVSGAPIDTAVFSAFLRRQRRRLCCTARRAGRDQLHEREWPWPRPGRGRLPQSIGGGGGKHT